MYFEELTVDGRTYLNSDLAHLRESGVPEASILSAAAGRLNAAIDARAEAIRSRYITPGFGQAMEYQEAQVQAFDALANPEAATPERFPMLRATIGLDIDPQTGAPATDVLGVARAIRAAYTAWVGIGAAVREARMSGKAAVARAATVDEAVAAVQGINWPS